MAFKQSVKKFVDRGLDRHLRLAVTGLSRAGKTAFITSFVNQLLHSSTHENLPLLAAANQGNLMGAKRIAQKNLMTPRFEYDLSIEQLSNSTPQWPSPTRDVSEISLAIRFRPKTGTRKYLNKDITLFLDIVDYPGEWLLDLPLLEMDFQTWSAQQLSALKGGREIYAKDWQQALSCFDPMTEADENQLAKISQFFRDYLVKCKENGLHWIQPGRFVLPGDLEGAPVLQFFPCLLNEKASTGRDNNEEGARNKVDEDSFKHSAYFMLEQRFEEYKKKVVKGFYQKYFSHFDRQIILVDCLQPLNTGYDAFMDMSYALNELMQSFKYGRRSLLNRLFSPHIDKVLFAATKADHITPNQHQNQEKLLQQLVDKAWQHIAYEGIDMACMSIASIEATQVGQVPYQGKMLQAIQGTTLEGKRYTLFPGEVPQKLPQASFWQRESFKFYNYRPQSYDTYHPLPHIRMDKVMQFLLGDKLR